MFVKEIGAVQYWKTEIVEARCSFDFHNLPFDVQDVTLSLQV